MRKSPFVGAVIVLASVVFVGCGSSDGIPDNSEETLSTYFESFATDDSTEMKKMLSVSGAGTPAHIYAEHQINAKIAFESDNADDSPSTANIDGQTVTMLPRDFPSDASTKERDDATDTYRDFEYAANGDLATWIAEPGGALAPRIRKQTAAESSDGVEIQLGTSYLTNVDDLAITLEVRNKSSQEVWVTPESYTNADRRQVEVSATPYEAELAAGNFATMYLSIANGQTGGELSFNLYFPDSFSGDKTLTLKVKR